MDGPVVCGRHSACEHLDTDQLDLRVPLSSLGAAQVELETASTVRVLFQMMNYPFEFLLAGWWSAGTEIGSDS